MDRTTTKRRLSLDASFFVCCGSILDDDGDGYEDPRSQDGDGVYAAETERLMASAGREDPGDHGLPDEVRAVTCTPAEHEKSSPEGQVAVAQVTWIEASSVAGASVIDTDTALTVEASRLQPTWLYRRHHSPYQVPPPPSYQRMTESISRRYAILSHRDDMRERHERLKMQACDRPGAATAAV